jgi:hypothetical protein
VVEVFSIGVATYDTFIHFLDSPNCPVAYQINEALINYLSTPEMAQKLSVTAPAYRFAVTGESLVFRTVNGRQVDCDLISPSTAPELNTVFGQFASHLVLLANSTEPAIPGCVKLPWTGEVPVAAVRTVDLAPLVELASNLVADYGTAAKTADMFVISLNASPLIVGTGELPAPIRERCQAADGKTIRCNFFELQTAFSRYCSAGDGILLSPVSVQTLGSTAKPENADAYIAGLRTRLAAAFAVEAAKVECVFLGQEAIVCRIEGIAADRTLHPASDDPLDSEYIYRPCPADEIVNNCVTGQNPTLVVHTPCIGFEIRHTVIQRLAEDDFVAHIKRFGDDFGFLTSSLGEYSRPAGLPDGVLGQMTIEVCHPLFAISLAQAIRNTIVPDATFDPNRVLDSTRTLKATNTCRHRVRIPGGPPPMKVNVNTHIQRVFPESEVKNVRQLLNRCGKLWRFDERYGILSVPGDEEDELRDLLLKLKRDEGRMLCQYVCDAEEPELLPQPLSVFKRDGSVERVGVCKGCQGIMLQELVAPFFNPNTHMLDQLKTADLDKKLAMFALDDEEFDEANGIYWPMIPLGVILWCLMSDKRKTAPFVRAWVSAVVEFALRHAPNLITVCPNHRAIPLRTPQPGRTMKCAHCNFMLCGTCVTWHDMGAPCPADDPTVKRCPGCRVPVTKVSGCNRITCRCGISFCYQCLAGFPTAAACYAHMAALTHYA